MKLVDWFVEREKKMTEIEFDELVKEALSELEEELSCGEVR